MHWRRKWQPTPVVLAWRIPGTGEPGGLPSMGMHRVGHDWSTLAAAAATIRHVLISCWLSSQGCFQFLEAMAVSCHMASSQNLPQYGSWLLHGQEENLFWAFHLIKSGPPRTIWLVINLKSVCFWTFITAWRAYLSIINPQSLLKLMSIESVMPSIHLMLCCPLLLSIFPCIRVFSIESVLCIRWPKFWGFNFSTSPSNEYSGLISFRMDWLDLLAVQGTLKSLLQHHSSKV